MKIRNISFFEQHAEKIALVVTGLVLAGAVYYYWLGDPHTVTINRQPAAPGEVDEIIAEEARTLRARLESGTPEELAAITVPPYTADFEGRRSEPLLPDTRLATTLGRPPLFEGDDPVPGTRHPFHVPNVPSTPIIAARAEVGTIAPEELEDIPELADHLGNPEEGEPADVTWVSLVGAFDMLDLINELSYYEDGVSRRVPESWWREDLAIVEVQVERQELLADGSWGSAEPVAPLPGEPTFEDLSGSVAPERADEIIEEVYGRQLDLVQRPFFALVGRTWSPPTPTANELDLERISTLREEISELEEDYDRLVRNIEQMQEQQANRPRVPQQQPRRGGAGGPGGGFGGPGGARGGGMRQQMQQQQQQQQGGGGQAQRRDDPRLEAAMRRLEEIIEELYEKESELAEILNQEAPERRPMPRGGGGGRGGQQGMQQGPGGPGGAPGGAGSMREMMQQQQQAPQNPFAQQGQMREMMQQQQGAGPGTGGQGGNTGRARGSASRFERPDIEAELDDELVRYRMDYFGAIPTDIIRERYVDVWAHDLNAEPGKTYRYRMRVAVVNPLNNRDTALPDDQREQYNDQFLLYGDWSDWSEPQEVEPLQHFFFVGGSASPAPGYVNAEVWRFTGGEWYQQEFRLVPGDPIGRVATVEDDESEEEVAIDFFTDAYVVDIDFNHPTAGNAGPLGGRSTQRVLYAVEGEASNGDVGSRVVAQDRRTLKREWLQIQQQIGPEGLTMR